MAATLQRLVFNLAAKVRKETHEGRSYLVAPVVLLTEGVHEGSGGPLFYPADRLKTNPAVWNHMPLVVYHPEANGEQVSARSPGVLDSRKVGLLFNATYDTKLRAEAWFDELKTKEVDIRVYNALEKGEQMEVSTGLYTDTTVKSGEFGGIKYDREVNEITPDHLAVLPDKVGACSLDKGCGLLQNEAAVNPLVVNGMSYNRVMSALRDAAESKFGYVYFVDVYDDFFIYAKEGYGRNNTLYQRPYSIDSEGKVTIPDGNPVEVKWVTEYRTTGGKFVGNCSCKESNVDKKGLIDSLLTLNTDWTAADRPSLELMTPERIQKEIDRAKKPAAPVVNAPPVPPRSPAPSEPVSVSVEQYIASAPPALQGPLAELVANAAAAKAELIARIKLNQTGQEQMLSDDYLAAQPLPALKVIANISTPRGAAPAPAAPNYGGQATVPGVVNSVKTEPLVPVEYDWAAK